MFGFIPCAFLQSTAYQDLVPADSRHPWAVKALNDAGREGALTGLAYESNQRLPLSRYQYTVAFYATATGQRNRLKAFLERPWDDRERAALIRNSDLIPAYFRAAKEFDQELLSLGVKDGLAVKELNDLTEKVTSTSAPRHHLFADVPVKHWAAKAIGDLRALEFLKGYPGERFTNSNR